MSTPFFLFFLFLKTAPPKGGVEISLIVDLFSCNDDLLVLAAKFLALIIHEELVLVRVVVGTIQGVTLKIPCWTAKLSRNVSVYVLTLLSTHLGASCWLDMKLGIVQSHDVGVVDHQARLRASHREALFVEVVIYLHFHFIQVSGRLIPSR